MFTLILLPNVAVLSPPDIVGIAYGISYCFKNLIDSFFPLITIGPLLDNYDPKYSILLLLGLSVIATILNSVWCV